MGRRYRCSRQREIDRKAYFATYAPGSSENVTVLDECIGWGRRAILTDNRYSKADEDDHPLATTEE